MGVAIGVRQHCVMKVGKQGSKLIWRYRKKGPHKWKEWNTKGGGLRSWSGNFMRTCVVPSGSNCIPVGCVETVDVSVAEIEGQEGWRG